MMSSTVNKPNQQQSQNNNFNNANNSSSGGGGNSSSTGLDVSLNYKDDEKNCARFLQEFSAPDPETGRSTRKYATQLQEIANRRLEILSIDLNDLGDWAGDDGLLVDRIMENAVRYQYMFTRAADKLIPEPDHDLNPDAENDVFEVFRAQRMQAEKNDRIALDGAGSSLNGMDGSGGEGPQFQGINELAPELNRTYQVVFSPPDMTKVYAIRQVKASSIGQLIQVRGIVTRVSDVRPKLVVATYTCDECGHEMYVTVPGQTYMPKVDCESERCKVSKAAGRIYLQTRGSKFVKQQEIKIQEMPDQVPIGHIPRTMTVKAVGHCTRQCGPGDSLTITGVFLPVPHEGYDAIKMGLLHQTYLECLDITRDKKSYVELSNQITEDMNDQIDLAANDQNIYDNLAMSLAPEIYGHEDVKKAMLLMLVGAPTRRMKDGMMIRGDINVCLMGDPGVAKSQLLKHIASVAPRGVYTTGKGSSGVGLTAAVTRDPITRETALEGGALVLADRGICCIDEFDKMEDNDRTAIHEVMEQQTVSIAKAGVTTTLNARTSILAAANPLFGRYNKRYSPADNINLPAALLSRFDLMFLLLDKTNVANDSALARHVTHVHRFNKHPDLSFEPMSPTFIRAYVSQARNIIPWISPEVAGFVVEEYVNMRQAEMTAAEEIGKQGVMTPRQLLSILRLALALARLRFDEKVSHADVHEAIRLVRVSKASVEDDDDNGADAPNQPREDATTRIYGILRALARNGSKGIMSVLYSDLEPVVLAKGFSRSQLETCLDVYTDLSVIVLNPTKTKISFVEVNQS